MIFVIVLAFICGNRGVDVGTDTENYINYFINLHQEIQHADQARLEPGFYFFTKFCSLIISSPSVFLSIIFFIQFIGFSGPFFRRSDLFKNYYFLAIIWLSFPFFYSVSLNVLRQGMAFFFVVYAFDRFLVGEKKCAYLMAFFAMLFHYVSFVYILSIKFSQLGFKPLVFIFILSVIMSFLNLQEYVVSLISMVLSNFGIDEYYLNYFSGLNSSDYENGFKLIFLLAISAPMILYLFFFKKFSKSSEFLMKNYIILSSIYFLFTNIPYSDRFALAAWLILPFIMIDFFRFRKNAINIIFLFSSPISVLIFLSYNQII
ncbi:EpsG family protein [Comamonas sp. HJ-2]